MNQTLDPNRKYYLLKLDQLMVIDWYPTPTPVGKPQQVHMLIDITFPSDDESGPLPVTFVTRFKTAAALDRFIESLLLHRDSVWGPWQRDPTIREDLEGWQGDRAVVADEKLLKALHAAKNALRSYQYGNASTELAEEIADHIEKVIAEAKK